MDDQVVPVHEALSMGAPALSIQEQIRRKHQDLQEIKTLDLPIPGYEGLLFARYRRMPSEELAVIGKAIRHDFKEDSRRMLYGSIDTLIAACEGFFVDDNGEVKSLADEIGDSMPVRYDDRLLHYIQLEPDDREKTGQQARVTVLTVFGWNDIAIVQHNMALSRWMGDPDFNPREGMGLGGT